MYRKSIFNFYLKKDGKGFLFNALTGAFVTLNKEYAEFYENEALWDEDLNKLEEFKRGGFIVDKELDELKLYYLKLIDSLWRKSGHSFTIVTTSECNFGCEYCYERQYGAKGIKMEKDLQQKVVDFIKDRVNTLKGKGVHITFYGGEPLLNTEAIIFIGGEVKKLCEELKVPFSSEMITNGYLLTKEVASFLKDEVNMRQVQITLDGPEHIHNKLRPLKNGGPTFGVIVENIRSILDSVDGFDIIIRSNLNKSNYQYYENLVKFVSEVIVKSAKYKEHIAMYPHFTMAEKDAISFKAEDKLFEPHEFGKIYVSYLLPVLIKYNMAHYKGIVPQPRLSLCMAPNPNSFLIDADGSFKKCWDFVGVKRYRIGSIEEGINLVEELKWLGYEYFDEKCKKCFFLPCCGGGCAKMVLVDGERKCDYRKSFLKEILCLSEELATKQNEEIN